MEQKKSFIISAIYYLLIFFLLFLAGYFLLKYAAALLVSLLLVMIIRPFINGIIHKFHINNSFIKIIVIIVVYLILISLFIYGSFLLLIELYTLLETSPKYIDAICQQLSKYTFLNQFITWVYQEFHESMNSLSLHLIQFLLSWISKIPSFLIELVFSIFISIYILIDYENIRYLLLHHRYQTKVLFVVYAVKDTLQSIFKTYSIIFFVIWFVLYIGFSFISLNDSLTLSFGIALFDFFPVLGVDMIFIPWIIICALYNQTLLALELLFIYGVIVVIKNVLESKLLSNQIGISPSLMMISIYIGMKLFSFPGIFIMPMIAMMIKRYFDIKK